MLKNQKIRILILSVGFILMMAGYALIFWQGAFPKPEEVKHVKYKVNMYVTP